MKRRGSVPVRRTTTKLEPARVRSLRKWRQLSFFLLGFAILFGLVVWLAWPHVSGFWGLIGAFAIGGKYVVLLVAPILLMGCGHLLLRWSRDRMAGINRLPTSHDCLCARDLCGRYVGGRDRP